MAILGHDGAVEHRRAVVFLTVATGSAITLLITVSPVIRLAYANVALHVLLDTAEAMVALLLAALCLGRFRRDRKLADLLLTTAFSVFAIGNLLLSVFAGAIDPERATGVAVWLAIILRMFGASAMCTAAFARPFPLGARLRPRLPVLAALVALALTGVAVLANSAFSELVDPSLSPESAARPRIVGHPVTLGSQLLLTGLYAGSAVGFLRSARRRDDLLFWLGAGAILRAFARFNYFLFPSLYSEWVYTGDILRLLGSCLYLVGAAKELGSYWSDQRRLGVLEERRRVGRELHDGLSQELAFLRSQLSSGEPLPSSMLPHLRSAAERAWAESRDLVTVLIDTAGPDLARGLRHAAEQVALREGVRVEVRVDELSPVRSSDSLNLCGIVREAASNAVRHGGATVVWVELSRAGDGVRLVIADDGRGFDRSARTDGFGLATMSERAAELGGTLLVESSPGGGTSVEILLPRS